jgi:protein MpaA
MRDYDDIVRRIEDLQGDFMHSRVITKVEGYPVYNITLSRDSGLPTVLLMGGVHGDEPAGVEAVLKLLQRDLDHWLETFCFEVIPCFNPHGYVHDNRHNGQDLDLNWAYECDGIPEIRALRDLIEGRRFEFVMDFHEDWESPGFYLYELCRGTMSVGPEVVRRVASICPLNTAALIEGQRAENGLVYPDLEKERKLRGTGTPLALYDFYSDHLLTSESPTGLALETRVQTHVITMETVMERYLST